MVLGVSVGHSLEGETGVDDQRGGDIGVRGGDRKRDGEGLYVKTE